VGTVVDDCGGDKMVEIVDDLGQTLGLPMVPAQKLELIAKNSD
jgi:hypothetical protein